jgi:hypothetical protein
VRTLSRALAVSCAAALAVPVLTLPAAAQPESGSEVASSAAYFTASAVPNPAGAPAAPPNLIRDSQLETVENGNLAVAASGSAETKVSFFYFSLTSIPFGSTITSATLTVPLVPDSATNRQSNARPENVRACAPDDTGFSSEDGQPLHASPEGTPEQLQYRGAPERKCDVFASAPATQQGDAYVFDISGLAATWDVANDGVALTRSEESDPSFQVVFSREATLTFEYTPPVEEDFSSDLGDLGDLDAFAGSGDASLGGFDGGSMSTDLSAGSFDAAPLTASLDAAPAPQTATDEPAVAAAPRATRGPLEVLAIPPGFWLAALVLAGALGFLGLVLGDRRTPALAAASRPTRLARALSAPAGQRPSLLGTRSA